jgi:C4-dicarboxylate transporter DctM subunit
MAGIVPGLLLAALLMPATWTTERIPGYPRMRKAALREVLVAIRERVWGLPLIAVPIDGIYTGVLTPTEAAAMSAAYALFVAVYVCEELALRQVTKVLLDSANLSAMLLYIITNAVLFSLLLASEHVPQNLAARINRMGLTEVTKACVPWILVMLAFLMLITYVPAISRRLPRMLYGN